MVTADGALLELLAQLRSRSYRFTAVTPETHRRVLARPRPSTLSLRDVFGWNRHFAASEIEPAILDLLRRADAVEESAEGLRSRVRVASLGERLFLHSSFPTEAADSVFFGPDTYRFCNFITEEVASRSPPRWIVDMGAGSGSGGIVLASAVPTARMTLLDVNPEAARLARINARFAGADAEVLVTDRIPSGCDLIIANPPYMIDSDHRTYRDGGGLYGGEVALDWARQALMSLAPGGRLLLYTGVAIVDGAAPLLDALGRLARDADATLLHRESDPDVFGDELCRPEYAQVERIAVMLITLFKGQGSFDPTAVAE
jgi:methylase of polypeptide subunit release factors